MSTTESTWEALGARLRAVDPHQYHRVETAISELVGSLERQAALDGAIAARFGSTPLSGAAVELAETAAVELAETAAVELAEQAAQVRHIAEVIDALFVADADAELIERELVRLIHESWELEHCARGTDESAGRPRAALK